MNLRVFVAALLPFLSASAFAQKHLVLDSRVVASTDRAELVVGAVEKDPSNPLFWPDRPWENALNNLYPNVLFDEDDQLYKLWYKCVLADEDVIAKMDDPSTVHGVGWYLLYATSKDGRTWTKPNLGLFGFDGSRNNNVVARGTPNVGVFKDTRGDCDPNRRYKMIYDVGTGNMRVRFSPDGIHWSDPVAPEGLGRVGDTHNNAWWDPELRKYVLITRLYSGQRLVARAESEDFVHWSTPTLALRPRVGEGLNRQMYCMPSFRYEGVYLGYLMMYQAKGDRTVDCELAWSPDSIIWYRVSPGASLIPRGPKGSYDGMCVYAPSGPPIVRNGMLEILYGGSDLPHRGWKRHCLPSMARLRVDGFAGYRPTNADALARVVTQPMVCREEQLGITADVDGGYVRVRAVDAADGSAWDFEPWTTSVTDGALVLSSGGKSFIQGRVVQLHFELHRATVYAFSGLERLPSPSVFPSARRFKVEVKVELGGPADAAEMILRYTHDGTDPTANSRPYESPFVVTEDTTVKAAYFLSDGRGPITTARFVPDPALKPAEASDAVLNRVSFDSGTQGWTGIDELSQRSERGLSGGCLTAVRTGGSGPILICGSDVLNGAYVGDLEKRYRGEGVEIRFAVRSSMSMRSLQLEVFGDAVGQWLYDKLAKPSGDWSHRTIRFRYDWTDADAEAAGWRHGPAAASWRATVLDVEKMVLVSAPAGEVGELEIDEFSIRSLERETR